MIEPNVCNTKKRLEALEAFRRRGVPTVVWLTPILPFINDTEENVLPILRACAEAGVKGIICYDMGLTLREGDREYFFAALDRHFPGLKKEYMVRYGNAYEVSSPNSPALMKLFHTFCEAHGMLHTPDACFAYLQEFPEKYRQTSLFDL